MVTFGVPEDKKYIKNVVGKGENAGNQHFLNFPHFYPINAKFQHWIYINISSANTFNFDMAKILSSGKGLGMKLLKETRCVCETRMAIFFL